MTSINHSNNLCLATLPSPSSSAESDKLQSKLEALEEVKKLCEFYENSKSQQNDPKNLLVNLCDGLEKFLGFNSASKGYDGTGIVYSDLDRLCDGVMAFLYGVLEAVKDDDAVKTYFKIKDTHIKHVESFMYSGQHNFALGIDAVKATVSYYEEELRKKTQAVERSLTALSTKIIVHQNLLDQRKTSDLTGQLGEWRSVVQNIQKELSNIISDNINALDIRLQGGMLHKIECVKSVVEQFEKVSGDAELETQVIMVDSALDEQRNYVMDKIEKESTGLKVTLTQQQKRLLKKIDDEFPKVQKALDDGFKKIYENMEGLDTIKNDHIKAIRNNISLAKGAIENQFDHTAGNFQTTVMGHFNDIMWDLRDLTKDDKDGMSRLKRDVHVIELQVEAINEKLVEYVFKLERWTKKNTRFIDDVKNDVEKIINKGVGTENQKFIKAMVQQIQTEAELLHGTFGQLKQRLEEEVKKVTGSNGPLEQLKDLEGLKGMVKAESIDLEKFKKNGDGGWDLESSITSVTRTITDNVERHVKNVILSNIQARIKGICGTGATTNQNNGLKQIVAKMQAYVEMFDEEQKFGTKIQDYIRTSVSDNDIVKGKLRSYIIIYNGRFNITLKGRYRDNEPDTILPEVNQLLIQQIESSLSSVIGAAKKDIPKNTYNIGQKLQGVHKCVNKFAEELAKQINTRQTEKTGKNTFVEAIVKAVEGKVLGPGEITGSYSIAEAVSAALSALHAKTSQIANELQSLAEASQLNNVAGKLKGAFDTANTLDGELGDAINDSAHLSAGSSIAVQVEGIGEKVNDVSVNTPLKGLLQDTANAAIKKLHEALNDPVINALGTVNMTVDGLVKEALGAKDAIVTKAGDITQQLYNLTEAFSKAGTGIQQFIELLSNEQISTDLAGIEKDIDNLRRVHLHNSVMAGMKGVMNVIERTEDVPKQVEAKTKEVEILMHGLKTDIISRFDDILRFVSLAGQSLTLGINALSNAVQTAHTIATDAVSQLYNDVTYAVQKGFEKSISAVDAAQNILQGTVQEAFGTMVNEVRKMFAKERNADLSALKSLVDTQKNDIQRLISVDRTTGVKGMMIALKGGDSPSSDTDNALTKLQGVMAPSVHRDSGKLKSLAEALKSYFDMIAKYIHAQHRPHHQADRSTGPKPKSPHDDPNVSSVYSFYGIVDGLLRSIIGGNNFNHAIYRKIHEADEAIEKFRPSKFHSTSSNTLLDIIKSGFKAFVAELKHVYVSRYSGATDYFVWNDDESKKCAKVCLSIVPTLYDALTDLKGRLDNEDSMWKNYQIYTPKASNHSLHRLFFSRHGYDLGLPLDAAHGELNHKNEITGEHILRELTDVTHHLFKSDSTRLTGDSESAGDGDGLIVDLVDEGGVIPELYVYVHQYYQVGHITKLSNTRSPCSVHDMLVWLDGLPHNPIYAKLADHIKSSCAKPEKYKSRKASEVDATELTLEKTSPLTARHLFDIILKLCANAHNLLTAIVGFGDEHSTYASDFANNALNFTYPSSGEDCLQTFLDILKRLFLPLRFMEGQCGHPSSIHGWASCDYGKNVDPSNWQCNDHSSNKPNGQPTDQPNGRANCRPTSPLMSYLTDCLPGHLPHHLKSIGCKTECNTCPKSTRGQPCLTPLGFRCFSGSMKTGKQLCRVLGKFFDNVNMSCLFTLGARPPSTLPEHFEFVLSLVKGWHTTSAKLVDGAFQRMFESSVTELSIGLYDPPSNLTDALRNAYGSTQNGHPYREVKRADLSCLSATSTNSKQPAYCAPYLHSLCHDSYSHMARKHANLYLSWAVSLPWDFYACLSNLLQALKDIFCQDWGCRSCMPGDKCKKGSHAVIDSTCQCTSVVACRGVSPTLYRFGFRFGVPWLLADKNSPKTCFEFQTQLANVLNSDCMRELFKQCDNFLFTIRAPFFWLTVALWSLSLFYLICVMVGRLDVLHIRSHLKIPSSHKITAQSLLAAAQVGRLAKISYLQP